MVSEIQRMSHPGAGTSWRRRKLCFFETASNNIVALSQSCFIFVDKCTLLTSLSTDHYAAMENRDITFVIDMIDRPEQCAKYIRQFFDTN
jgi:hypothetical protein